MPAVLAMVAVAMNRPWTTSTANRRCYQLTAAEQELLRSMIEEAVTAACATPTNDPVAFVFGFLASAARIDGDAITEHMTRLLASRAVSQ